MDAETIRWLLTGAASVITILGGIILRNMMTALEDQKKEHALTRTDLETVRREYMHKNDFKDFKDEFKEMLQEFKHDIKQTIASK